MQIINTINHQSEVLKLLNRRWIFQGGTQELSVSVATIIKTVRDQGDQGLCELTSRFDGVFMSPDALRVSEVELEQAAESVSIEFLEAVRLAKENIMAFHRKQLPKDWLDLKANGVILGQRFQAVSAAGLYIPGGIAGTTPLVSSVLMNALPALVAGVERIVICTPPDSSKGINPYLLVAAQECGCREIYKVGGAQAIAAMAFGTPTILPVDVITGPGNQYVTEAKRQVYGYVGLDMLAGPSEILIIADTVNRADFIAADLLSQAEHGPVNEAGAFLLTPSLQLAEQVKQELETQLTNLSRAKIARQSLDKNGAIIVTSSLDEAFELANYAAPEHIELLVAEPWSYLSRIKHAGAVFIGPYSTEPIGDYVAGTNHVLPTNGSARFASGLNVEHFMKKSSLIAYNQAGIDANGMAAIELARVEGLDAHANAVRLRQNNKI